MAIENEVVIIAEAVALPGKREELRRAFVEDLAPSPSWRRACRSSGSTRTGTFLGTSS
jgi:hypothetical protein